MLLTHLLDSMKDLLELSENVSASVKLYTVRDVWEEINITVWQTTYWYKGVLGGLVDFDKMVVESREEKTVIWGDCSFEWVTGPESSF